MEMAPDASRQQHGHVSTGVTSHGDGNWGCDGDGDGDGDGPGARVGLGVVLYSVLTHSRTRTTVIRRSCNSGSGNRKNMHDMEYE